MRFVRFLIIALLAFPAAGDPFQLLDPSIAASHWIPDAIEIGSSGDGYLLAGLAAHHPAAIPLRTDGLPSTGGLQPLGVASAIAVSEPVRRGSQWNVIVSPGSYLDDRIALAQLDTDGYLLSSPILLDWQDVSRVGLAANGRTAVVVALITETPSETNLVLRTIDLDSGQLGQERFLAGRVTDFEIVPTAGGFIVVWLSPDGLWMRRVDDQGFARGDARRVVSATRIQEIELASTPNAALLVWTTGDLPSWTVEGAWISDGGGLDSLGYIDAFSASSEPSIVVESLDGGFIVGWQRVDLIDGQRAGRETYLRRFNDAGQPTEAAWTPSAFSGREVLVASASRTDSDLLLAFTRTSELSGRSLWSTVVRGHSSSTPHLVSVVEGSPQSLELTSAGDGSSWGVWVETTGTGYRLNTTRWNSRGERQTVATIAHVTGLIGGFDIATNGAETMVVWQQERLVFTAALGSNGSLAREPFRLAFVATVEQGLSGADPAITWSGTSFIATWKQDGQIRAARISPTGIQRPLGAVATVPVVAGVKYEIGAIDLAAIGNQFLLVADVTETFSCSAAPCPQRSRIGFALTDGASPQTLALGPVGVRSRVAAGPGSYLIGWSSTDGLRLLSVAPDGALGEGVLAFRWPSPGQPAISWSGGSFTVSARYGIEDWARVAILRVDAAGRSTAPDSGFDVSQRMGEAALHSAWIGNDVLLGWVSRGLSPSSPFTLFGHFSSAARSNVEAPAEPAVQTVTRVDGNISLSWSPVPGAERYQVDHLVTWPDGSRSWVHTLRTMGTTAVVPPGEFRVLALGRGGASGPPPPAEETASRKRSIRRP